MSVRTIDFEKIPSKCFVWSKTLKALQLNQNNSSTNKALNYRSLRCHSRVIEHPNFLKSAQSVRPVDLIVPTKDSVRLVSADAHNHRVRNPGLAHVRDRAMPQVVEVEIVQPRLQASVAKPRPRMAQLIPTMVKHVRTSHSPRNPLQDFL